MTNLMFIVFIGLFIYAVITTIAIIGLGWTLAGLAGVGVIGAVLLN
jgi:hypothetical protein